jgi:hypothetical protein
MTEEKDYKPQGARSGKGAESVLRYLLEDLRLRTAQPVIASPQGDSTSVQPMFSEPSRSTPAGQANE